MTTGDGAAGEGWYFSLEYPAHYLVGASIMQSREATSAIDSSKLPHEKRLYQITDCPISHRALLIATELLPSKPNPVVWLRFRRRHLHQRFVPRGTQLRRDCAAPPVGRCRWHPIGHQSNCTSGALSHHNPNREQSR